MGVFQTEGSHAGEFIVSEVSIDMCREVVTILSGENLAAGTVLGKITASGKYVGLDPVAADGSEAAAGILFDNTDASLADTEAVIINNLAVVNNAELDWGAADAGQQATAVGELKALNVFVKGA